MRAFVELADRRSSYLPVKPLLGLPLHFRLLFLLEDKQCKAFDQSTEMKGAQASLAGLIVLIR